MFAYALVSQDQPITKVELPIPPTVNREVLLRVAYAGVCHTDTHLREGAYDLGSRGKLKLTDRGITYPLVMGHESVGRVTAHGPEVTAHAIGDLRLIYPWIGCGNCTKCQNGDDTACLNARTLGVNRPGGYAEYIHVPDERYILNIDGLDPEWAATLACSGLTAYAAVKKVLPQPPETPVVIIGAGGVGLMAVAILRALGHTSICVVDTNENSLLLAVELGATATVIAGLHDSAQNLAACCGGQVSSVVDFVNNGQTAQFAFDSLGRGGKLVQVGLYGGEVAIPTALMALKMLTLQGSYVGTVDELIDLIELAKRGVIPKVPITSGPLDAHSIQSTLDGLAAGSVSGRVVLAAQ